MLIDSSIIDFCKHKSKIYIYGNGKTQKHLQYALEKSGITVSGLIISDNYNIDNDDKTTYRISQLIGTIKNNNREGVILSVSDKYYNEVLRTLNNYGIGISNIYILSSKQKTELKVFHSVEANDSERFLERDIGKYYADSLLIEKNCKQSSFNVLCHMHLGDTVMKQSFEEKFKSNLHYLIPHKQEVLSELYGIRDYSLVTLYSDNIQPNLDKDDQRQKYEYSIDIYNKLFSCVPQIGRVFVPASINLLNSQYPPVNFVDESARLLGIHKRRVKPPKRWKVFSNDMIRFLRDKGSLDRMVLLAPEASSLEMLPLSFWNELAKKIRCEGKIPVCSVLDKNNCIKEAENIEASMSDLIAFGNMCNSVYSIRSGLCDCLAGIGKKLTVYYKNRTKMEYYSINNCFDITEEVNEILV